MKGSRLYYKNHEPTHSYQPKKYKIPKRLRIPHEKPKNPNFSKSSKTIIYSNKNPGPGKYEGKSKKKISGYYFSKKYKQSKSERSSIGFYDPKSLPRHNLGYSFNRTKKNNTLKLPKQKLQSTDSLLFST